MGQHLLKMYIDHRRDVLKLMFRVNSNEGLKLERLSSDSLNGGQFTYLVQSRKPN